jgi:hypothetical protein
MELNTSGKAAEWPYVRLHSSFASGRLVLCVLIKTLPARPEALTILEQFVQLKGVADGMHDSVLQH